MLNFVCRFLPVLCSRSSQGQFLRRVGTFWTGRFRHIADQVPCQRSGNVNFGILFTSVLIAGHGTLGIAIVGCGIARLYVRRGLSTTSLCHFTSDFCGSHRAVHTCIQDYKVRGLTQYTILTGFFGRATTALILCSHNGLAIQGDTYATLTRLRVQLKVWGSHPPGTLSKDNTLVRHLTTLCSGQQGPHLNWNRDHGRANEARASCGQSRNALPFCKQRNVGTFLTWQGPITNF